MFRLTAWTNIITSEVKWTMENLLNILKVLRVKSSLDFKLIKDVVKLVKFTTKMVRIGKMSLSRFDNSGVIQKLDGKGDREAIQLTPNYPRNRVAGRLRMIDSGVNPHNGRK